MAELTSVIADIRQKVADYNLTAADLGFGELPATAEKPTRSRRSAVKQKYRDPASGKSWSGPPDGRAEVTHHREVYRPWGSYDSIDQGERFQVKRITVKPGERLSLQMHHHRAEHWIVVRGTAEVRCGDKTLLLTENQSTYIPLGELHQLANPGKVPLEIIEVQSGSYLGEDDTVRFEDRYGRV